MAALCGVMLGTAHAAGPVKLLAFGDSLTAGYGLPAEDGFVPRLQAALRASGRDVIEIDGGVSGDTTTDAVARLDWSLADHPDAAIVEFGANDGLRGTDAALMERNLTTILDRLAQDHVPTLLSGMYAPPNFGPEYVTAFRHVFDRLSSRPGILYDPFFLQGVALHQELIQPDGLHPNAAGVVIIVNRILPLVEKLVDEATSARGHG
jgi:acyl-CoA thioesterase-1